jgi:DNA-directed RNA polymerase subunit M/transcription elongation factor TFIIS
MRREVCGEVNDEPAGFCPKCGHELFTSGNPDDEGERLVCWECKSEWRRGEAAAGRKVRPGVYYCPRCSSREVSASQVTCPACRSPMVRVRDLGESRHV